MKKLLIVLILFFSYDAYSQTAEDYFDRAYDKDENGDYYGAISDLNKAIELNPDDPDVYNNRGIAKGELKDYYGAISDFNKAIKIDSSYPNAYFGRGVIKALLENYNEACQDARKAKELGHETSEVADVICDLIE